MSLEIDIMYKNFKHLCTFISIWLNVIQAIELKVKLFCGTMLLGHIIAVQQVPLGSV